MRDLQGRLDFANSEVNRLNKQSYDLLQRLTASASLEEKNVKLSDALVLQTALSESLTLRINDFISREGEVAETVKKSKKAEQDKEAILNQLKLQDAHI